MLDVIRFDGILYSSSKLQQKILPTAVYCASVVVLFMIIVLTIVSYQAIILNSFFFVMPVRIASMLHV